MRRPVNSPYTITTEFGVRDSYALFGYHSGVDYAVPLNRPIYAPTSGQLTNVVSPTGGNMVVIFDGQFYHRLMHNNSFARGNGAVSEGEIVAYAGTTGLSTGVHCHWDINRDGQAAKSFASFIAPADWLAGKYIQTNNTGGVEVIGNGENWYGRLNKLHTQVRGYEFPRSAYPAWIGQPILKFIETISDHEDANKAYSAQQWALTNRARIEQQVADLTTALANEKNKPAKEVIKEVEKIVEKEVIKEIKVEVPVAAPIEERQVVENWLKRVWGSLFNRS